MRAARSAYPEFFGPSSKQEERQGSRQKNAREKDLVEEFKRVQE